MSAELVISKIAGSVNDLNSLLSGDPTQFEWSTDAANNLVFINRDSVQAGAWLLNPTGIAAASGLYRAKFAVPAGVTQVILTAVVSSSSGTTSIRVPFYDTNFVETSAQRYAITTGTPLVIQQTFPVTAGAQYGLGLQMNDLGQQARVFLWGLQIRPVANVGLFAADFVRIRNSASLMGDTSMASTAQAGIYLDHSRMADIDIMTDASRMAVECYNNSQPVDLPAQVAYLAANRPHALSAAYTNGIVSISEDALPPMAGDPDVRLITVRSHPTSYVGYGCFVRAIYAPLESRTRIVPTPAPQRLVIVGDSISCGYFCINPHWANWPAVLRQRYPGSVTCMTSGAMQLRDVAVDATTQDATAYKLAQTGAVDIIIALGVNDFLGTNGNGTNSAWTAAAFGTAAAALADKIHSYLPSARVSWLTPLSLTAPASEAANNLGSTLPNYRTQITGLDASRSPWFQSWDGTGATFPAADYTDGIHFTTNGYGLIARGVTGKMVLRGAM